MARGFLSNAIHIDAMRTTLTKELNTLALQMLDQVDLFHKI